MRCARNRAPAVAACIANVRQDTVTGMLLAGVGVSAHPATEAWIKENVETED